MRISPLGDSAITITLGDGIDTDLSRRVCALADHIAASKLPSVLEVVPAYAALAVYYDPEHEDYSSLAAQLQSLVASAVNPGSMIEGREHRIPVRYDGPDLSEVAERSSLTVAEVIERHSAPWYQVYLIGFVPGFAYLGDLDPTLVLPRRAEPRKRVPAGSVAIAGAQTGVYPLETPGGWHLIGRTDTVLFDPHRSPAALLHPGDRVRFEPIASMS
jgi:inhibitor of KinA